jgi:hypothetical protein
VLRKKGHTRRDLDPLEGAGARVKKGRHSSKGNLAPVIGRWAEACFPVGSETTEAELRELLKESEDSAKDDYGPDAAVAWTEGYSFPPEYVRDDIRCLEAAQGDFLGMVRQRLRHDERSYAADRPEAH